MSAMKAWLAQPRRPRPYRPVIERLEDLTLPSFLPPVSYGTDPYSYSVAVGDFANDGITDLAVTSSTGVDVLLGNGDGTFQTAQSYATATENGPSAVTVADLNGDGILDLVVANNPGVHAHGTVSVLLGNGDGSFQAPQNYAVGVSPRSVAVADLNGDGIPDVVTADYEYGPSWVSVLLGNGDGTFQPYHDFTTAAYSVSVAVGDFNGDGIPDLVTANWGHQLNDAKTVSVLLGNGDGTFQQYQTYGVGNYAYSVAVGDFNGDGILDLAVANSGSNTVSVLLGNGDGSFQAKQDYATGGSPNAVAVADINGDGIPDLVTANQGSGSVSVLLGNGDGTFAPKADFAAGPQPTSVAVGDFNGDSFPDLAVSNYGGTANVLINAADWTAPQAVTRSTPRPSGRAVSSAGHPFLDPLSASAVAHNAQSIPLLTSPEGSGLDHPVSQAAVNNMPAQTAQSDGTAVEIRLAPGRHAPAADWEEWADVGIDWLAWH